MRAVLALFLIGLMTSCQQAKSESVANAATPDTSVVGQLTTPGQFVEVLIGKEVVATIDPFAVKAVARWSKRGGPRDQMLIYLYPGFPTIPPNQPFALRIPEDDKGKGVDDDKLAMVSTGWTQSENGGWGGDSEGYSPVDPSGQILSNILHEPSGSDAIRMRPAEVVGCYTLSRKDWESNKALGEYEYVEKDKAIYIRFPNGISKEAVYAVPYDYRFVVPVVIKK